MKKTFSLLFTILFAITAYTQEEVIGTTFIQPTIGLNITSTICKDGNQKSKTFTKDHSDLTVGADFGYRSSKHFMPSFGLFWNRAGIKCKTISLLGSSTDNKVIADYLSFPLQASYVSHHPIHNFRIGGGVQPSICLGASGDENISMNNFSFGLCTVIGYSFKNKLSIELRSSVGLANDYDHRDNLFDSNLYSSNLTMSSITIGYRFNIKKH
ncbi:MAG: outer membrane beta-barrel protein [Prevotellaceae bacterium]|nr:outer membrane beta-barrel protein [Candidatus Minthosoma caballi]